ncbi:MAG: phosphodiesterase [Mycobacterium sp.]
MKASDLVALPLQLGSVVRQRRVFHPLGVLASGRIDRVAPPGQGLPIDSGDVLARTSKAVGTPGGLPDLLGLAWRMAPHGPSSTPWDVLMVSAGSGLLTRFVLRPTRSWPGTTLSSLMPLRYREQSWWLRAEMTTQIGKGMSLDVVRDGIDGGGVVFTIQQAQGSGPFHPLAELTLTTTIPTDQEHDVSFDPTRNTMPGVSLGPEWLTTLRERAYRRSRHGREAPDEEALT